MQHGVMDSADTFIMNYPNKSPAYQLADDGYDVWLGNSRGNKYSNKHTTFNTKSKDYWENVDFENMALHDTPTNLKFITK
jgi:hypothetical protein